MRTFSVMAGVIFLGGLLAMPAVAADRDQIRIVGSSIVFPFSMAVAENFGRNTPYKTPIVQSTGTGGGFQEFCNGVGTDFVDLTGASRPIKDSEIANCH